MLDDCSVNYTTYGAPTQIYFCDSSVLDDHYVIGLRRGADPRLDAGNGTAIGEVLAESPVVAQHVVAEIAGSMPCTVACGTGYTASIATNDGLPGGHHSHEPRECPRHLGGPCGEDVADDSFRGLRSLQHEHIAGEQGGCPLSVVEADSEPMTVRSLWWTPSRCSPGLSSPSSADMLPPVPPFSFWVRDADSADWDQSDEVGARWVSSG